MYQLRFLGVLTLAAPVLFLSLFHQGEKEPTYYVALFAAQDENLTPRLSHSWATFVKVKNGKAGPELEEQFTISWLPDGGVIRPIAIVKGRNYTLEETLKWAKEQGLVVIAWEPLEINDKLYDLAKQRKNQLESGAIAYKMLDRRVRGGDGTNCIHAISDLVPDPLLDTGLARGEQATAPLAQHFRPYMTDPTKSHPEVLKLLPIERDAITIRTLVEPEKR